MHKGARKKDNYKKKWPKINQINWTIGSDLNNQANILNPNNNNKIYFKFFITKNKI